MSMIDPVTLALVKSALDASQLRQVAHANNLANVGSEGYRPFKVVFEERLGAVRSAIAEGRTADLSASGLPAAELLRDDDAVAVSLDTEVAALSRNSLHYQALVKALSKQYALMNLAVSEGRR